MDRLNATPIPSQPLTELAELLGATLEGECDFSIEALCTLEPGVAGGLSFLAQGTYAKHLAETQAAAVIVSRDQERPDGFTGCLLRVDYPYGAWAQALDSCGIHPHWGPTTIDPSADIHPSVQVAAGVQIGAHVRIGEGTVLHPNVTIYANSQIGSHCILHAGVVIGADGFGFAKDGPDWVKIAQLGGVIIGDYVEVGAGTTIDRGALDNTIIGDGVKLDNQVQIAHNVVLGDYTAIAGCTAIAGSTKLGKHCTIAGACGITGHLTLVDGVHVTAMSLVTHSITEPGAYSSGTGLDKNQKWRRNATRFKQLDQMAKRLKQLELEIVQLRN